MVGVTGIEPVTPTMSTAVSTVSSVENQWLNWSSGGPELGFLPLFRGVTCTELGFRGHGFVDSPGDERGAK